jgi:hypothetical protein
LRDEGGLQVIPTRFKSKLPKTLSWPVGAEAISVGLGDAPHVPECELWFSDSPVWRASEFQRTLREARPYAVLVVEYRPVVRMGYEASNERAASGDYDARWFVRVNPVPRSSRAMVGRLLREQGLPAAAEWLRTVGRPGWEERSHRLELVFAPADGTLSKKSNDGV